MERLKSLDEYNSLIKECKIENHISFNNMYSHPQQVDRYIQLNRLYYEKLDCGIALYLDEESYYRVCLLVDAQGTFTLEKKDKKLLIRNIYNGNSKNERLISVENQIEKLGFKYAGTSQNIRGNAGDIIESKKVIESSINRIKMFGFSIKSANYENYKEIVKLLEAAPFIEDYHIDYHTAKEIDKNLELGGYLCIVDKENKVCAATITWLSDNGMAYGSAIVTDNKYARLGLAPIISYERMKWIQSKGANILSGWVLTNNEPSIRYHKSMGFDFIDRFADEWIKL